MDWTVDVNVDSIRRVKAALQVNLLDVVKGELTEQLKEDPILLVDVLYVLCKPQADQRGTTDEDFGRAMGGDAIDRALLAFFTDLTEFFPNGKRQVLAKVLAKMQKLQEMGLDKAHQVLDGGELERTMEKLLNASSGSSPGPSASTPDPSPSASSS